MPILSFNLLQTGHIYFCFLLPGVVGCVNFHYGASYNMNVSPPFHPGTALEYSKAPSLKGQSVLSCAFAAMELLISINESITHCAWVVSWVAWEPSYFNVLGCSQTNVGEWKSQDLRDVRNTILTVLIWSSFVGQSKHIFSIVCGCSWSIGTSPYKLMSSECQW